MSGLKVTFTLGDRDLRHFKRIMAKAIAAADTSREAEIVEGCFEMGATARAAKPPEYVIERIDKLETIARMTQDTGWSLPEAVRQRILAAISYFTDPEDLIPDQIPGLGFLDDAIMIELVAHELRHELWGYDSFSRFRTREEERPWYAQGRVTLEKKLANQRKSLRTKVRERAARDREADPGGKRGFRLWR